MTPPKSLWLMKYLVWAGFLSMGAMLFALLFGGTGLDRFILRSEAAWQSCLTITNLIYLIAAYLWFDLSQRLRQSDLPGGTWSRGFAILMAGYFFLFSVPRSLQEYSSHISTRQGNALGYLILIGILAVLVYAVDNFRRDRGGHAKLLQEFQKTEFYQNWAKQIGGSISAAVFQTCPYCGTRQSSRNGRCISCGGRLGVELCTCPFCNNVNPFGSERCFSCNAPLEVPSLECPYCHTKNPLNSPKCMECGGLLKPKAGPNT